MKTFKAILLVLVIILLCSCQTLATGFGHDKNKVLIHNFTQVTFPNKVSDFEFVEAHNFDNNGFDVSVGYDDIKNSISLTHYVYPSIYENKSIELSVHVVDCESEITAYHKNSTLLNSSTGSVNGVEYQKRIYKYKEKLFSKVIDVNSMLVLFKEKNWFVKIRATYPSETSASCESDIDKYISQIVWPKQDLEEYIKK